MTTKRRDGICYMGLNISAAVMSVVCLEYYQDIRQAAAVFAFIFLVLVIGIRDACRMEIADWLVVLLLGITLLSVWIFSEPVWWERLLGSLSVSMILISVMFAMPGSFGGGDVKFMAVCGIFLGWRLNLLAFVLAVLSSGAYCLIRVLAGRLNMREQFAFGPFLCLGVTLVSVNGSELLAWWNRSF